MKFLADHDVYALTTRFLRGLGHDVVTADELGLALAEDAELLTTSRQLGRIFVTRDRDFGGLVFVQGAGAGIVYLRILPSTQSVVHDELERVLSLYSESEMQTAFIVVEPGRHRLRRFLPNQGP